MKKYQKILAFILAALMLLGLIVPTVFAAEPDTQACTVIGSDLNQDQIQKVYSYFGIDRGTVTELKVTNTEERTYLEGKISDKTIGTRSISCVYIRLREEGAGLAITCKNINWCTAEVYRNALITAGIYDADVIIAAPFEVSGTAALTGIYKAYEMLTGKTLDENAKDTAVDELIITSDLADEIGSADASEIVNELKLLLDETRNMTDAELDAQIREIANGVGVELDASEIAQLISLCRQMEKLNVSQLTEKVSAVQGTLVKVVETLEKVEQAKEQADGFFNRVGKFFLSIGSFFKSVFGSKNK